MAYLTDPEQSALPEQREHGGEASTIQDFGVGDLVSPADAKDAAKTSQVKAVQLPLLLGFSVQGQGQVVGDGGAEVGELVDHFQLVVVDGDDRWRVYVVAQYVCLLQASQGKSAENCREHGVGFAFRNTFLKMVEPGDKGWESLLTLRLHTSDGPAALINAYAPTLTSTPEATNLKHVFFTRSSHSADCDTDHSLVCCKIRLIPKKFHRSKPQGKPRIDTTKMQHEKMLEEFAKSFEDVISTDHPHSTASETWNHLRQCIQTSALATFGKKTSVCCDRLDAKSPEMTPVIEVKRATLAEYKRTPSEKTLQALRKTRSKVQQTARRCANEYWQELNHDIQTAATTGNIRRMYEGTKKALGPTQSKTAPLKSTNGEVITDKVLQLHNSLFDGQLGKLNKIEAKLNRKAGATSVFHKARPVPFAKKLKISENLNLLESQGIIEKVQYSEWVAPIVTVDKPDGGVRICGGFKVTVNPELEVDKYPLPRIDEIFTNVAGGK
ncbi:Uncharacterized protein K02A2.6 [Stylophora pistillata]|uniref:Uncharacterized protein K02A2.6 n=1 Tax=Stylophora pistillata TaxID=50429 RepID=A0A2B4RTS7_STYPI|nr:Uncharacterized protein K02A2.6 [Stylophora pistillata]